MEYTYDHNDNLLSDGVNTYVYDSANRLISASNALGATTYAYRGLPVVRLQETVNGQTTTFTVDLAAGLTQTLDDGKHAYLYGYGRISQENTTGSEYFLGDALGSVRQLTDESGALIPAKTYDPFGVVRTTSGTEQSSYGFTGEMSDPTGLVYLRARYYSPINGRFLTRDTWAGDVKRPLSFNKWGYVEDNAVNRIDPSGHTPECGPFEKADLTDWFMDEMNIDKDTWIIQTIKANINLTNVDGNPLGYIAALSIFADAVQPYGLWDFKARIGFIVGANIRISDTWYFNDVPGNIAFGYLGLAAGISEQDLHCGADWANDRTICSGSDPDEDKAAIEAGFDLWKATRGGIITLPALSNALQTHALHAGKPEPPLGNALYHWPYNVGEFDGWTSQFVHR